LTPHPSVEEKDYAKPSGASTMTESGLSIQTMMLLALLSGVVVWRMKKMFGEGE
jgi:hypothetical protein